MMIRQKADHKCVYSGFGFGSCLFLNVPANVIKTFLHHYKLLFNWKFGCATHRFICKRLARRDGFWLYIDEDAWPRSV